MSRTPIRPPARPPGFSDATRTKRLEPQRPAAPPISRRAGTRQINLRLLLPLHERYRRLLRDCNDAGFETSLTEIIHALLYAGPHDVDSTRRMVRNWRSVLEGGP